MSSKLSELRHMHDAQLMPGASNLNLDDFLHNFGIPLPDDHLRALSYSNGATVYGGYARMFGINIAGAIDAVQWNRFDYWKFAWEHRCIDYFCFAETIWGDQYAYNIERLRQGDERVYFLDWLSMTPEVVASSFSGFLESELIRIATAPYDIMMVRAREKFGDIDPENHLTYSPSLVIGGSEEIENIVVLQSRVAMIFNGDIALQIDTAPESSVIKAVVPYDDEARRPRLRLILS